MQSDWVQLAARGRKWVGWGNEHRSLTCPQFPNPKYCSSSFCEPRSSSGSGGHFNRINRVGSPSLSVSKIIWKWKRNASGCGVYKEGAEETVGRKEKQGLSGKDGGIRCSESCEPINDCSAGLYGTNSSGTCAETKRTAAYFGAHVA